MKQELDEKLCKKYPKIFADRHGNMRETSMCWGFECGDGWYDIIDALCLNIQHYIDQNEKNIEWTKKWNNDVNDPLVEWMPYWAAREEKPIPERVPQVVAVQVKEKFGSLRFYCNSSNDVIDAMISMAESMSIRTCEICGDRGSLTDSGWIQTLCDKHKEDKNIK